MTNLQFAHVALVCADPLEVERFYAKYFGFERRRVVPTGDGRQVVFTTSGTLTLEIFPTDQDRPLPPPDRDGYPFPGWRHLAFRVDDIDAKVAELGADARITLGPLGFDEVISGWRTVWVSDPEGNIIEISQGYRDEAQPPPLPPAWTLGGA